MKGACERTKLEIDHKIRKQFKNRNKYKRKLRFGVIQHRQLKLKAQRKKDKNAEKGVRAETRCKTKRTATASVTAES